jgi:flagellar hook-associated protein 2
MQGLSGGFDPKMVEQLIQASKIPLETAKKRKEEVSNTKKEYTKVETMLNELDTALKSLRTRGEFKKLKVDSSHPDIIDGVADATALEGEYEFEVRGLAKREKELAYGFPDRDKSAVGFGFMLVEREDGQEPAEILVPPGSTLQDVANKINDADIGVRAMVVNTKYNPDPYRLLVVSDKSGAEARISIDPDTTFLEFKEQVTGHGLDVLFEDVPITDDKNTISEVVPGVTFNIKRAEPGTRITVGVSPDVDKTIEGIKAFVDKYNALAEFVHNQFAVDPETKKAGPLSGDGSLKMVMRQLQGVIAVPTNSTSKFNSLADIGITTNPKTGTLTMDEAKVKKALSEDIDGVARLFVRTGSVAGVAERLAEQLRGIRDPNSGAIKTRTRALDRIIENQDEAIARKERNLDQQADQIRRKFATLDQQMGNLQSQGAIMAARLGGAGGGGQGGAPGG